MQYSQLFQLRKRSFSVSTEMLSPKNQTPTKLAFNLKPPPYYRTSSQYCTTTL